MSSLSLVCIMIISVSLTALMQFFIGVLTKFYTMIRDHSPDFSYFRKEDSCPLEYQKVC